MSKKVRISGAVSLGLLLAAAAAWPASAIADDGTVDLRPMAAALVGSWAGEGLYDGNRLELTREWSLDLADSVLRGDCGWTRAVSSSLWTPRSTPRPGDVWIESTDPHAEGGPALRRIVYHVTGEDSYVEEYISVDLDLLGKPVKSGVFTNASRPRTRSEKLLPICRRSTIRPSRCRQPPSRL